jgi:hypothetical protein
MIRLGTSVIIVPHWNPLVAADIRRYEALGVGHLVMDFVRLSRNLDDMLQHMEALATQAWPRV